MRWVPVVAAAWAAAEEALAAAAAVPFQAAHGSAQVLETLGALD